MRVFDPEFTMPNASGLAYSPVADTFLLLDENSTEQPGEGSDNLTMISPFEELVGSANLPAVANPINMAFDSRANRLLMFDTTSQELVAIMADQDGFVDPAAIVRFAAQQFGVQDPRGMAVDPESGVLFVLSRTDSRIVRIVPDAQGSFDGAAALAEGRITNIDLSGLGLGALQGLAFDPTDGHIHVLNPAQKTLHEISEAGQLVATRDMSNIDPGFRGFRDPQGIVFAPSADLTDDPAQMHLFLMDSGLAPLPEDPFGKSQLYLPLIVVTGQEPSSAPFQLPADAARQAGQEGEGPGRIIELTLVAPVTVPPAVDLPAANLVTNLTLPAAADARVLQTSPTTNYGTLTRIEVDSPDMESYIRFNVSGVTGTVQNATLRLFSTNGSSNGPSLSLTGNSWTETGITWNNRPSPSGGAIADVGAVTSDTWAEYDVTAQVTGDGTYDFVLLPDSTDGATFYSREGSTPPQLVLTFDTGPAPTPTDTSTPGPTNTPTNTPTATNTPQNTPTPTNTPTSGPTGTPTNTPTSTNTPVNTPTSTSTPLGSSLTLPAAADARVLQTNPTINYGAISRLDVDDPGQESYIRFTVSGVTGAVQSATLRLFATNGSSNGPSLFVTGNSWTETGITWNNRPAPIGGAIANVAAVASNTRADYDVTALVVGNGTYDFVLQPDSTDGITFYSREGNSPPQLVLTFASGPTPTPTNTATPGPSPTPTITPTSTNTPSSSGVVFVGAGDIANCNRVQDEQTAQLLDNIPGTVFTIGDNAYPGGTASAFNNCYEPTWGRHKARTHPAVGDNEYNTTGASGYFNYFGAAAGDPTKGYYSYDLGSWHIITLNSECSRVGGCDPDSPQGQWLQADLAAHPNQCILAIHHEPLFSSNGGDSDLQDFWDPLYAAGADIVLSGHRHNYERFAQQTPNGVLDPVRGIRQFVVGTGGTSLSTFDGGPAPNSQVRNDRTNGVLKFTLYPDRYDWQFIPIAGQTFTDSGTTSCVNP